LIAAMSGSRDSKPTSGTRNPNSVPREHDTMMPAFAGPRSAMSSTSIDMSGHHCARKRAAAEVSGTETVGHLKRPRQDHMPSGRRSACDSGAAFSLFPCHGRYNFRTGPIDRDFIATGRHPNTDDGFTAPILSSIKNEDGQYIPENVQARDELHEGYSVPWKGGLFGPAPKWESTMKIDKSTQTKFWQTTSVASDEDTVRTHLAIGDRSPSALKARLRHHDAAILAPHWPPTEMQTADAKTSSTVRPVPSGTKWPECRTFPGMFKPGWHIGAYFRCHKKRGFHHRVYEGPPDGTERVRLGPNEITIDFSRAFQVKALFCNETYSAVQFRVKHTLPDGSTKSQKVWTNIRKGGDWWAEVVPPSGTGSSSADVSGQTKEAIVVAPKVRSVSCHRASPSSAIDQVD
jgi:hypothetical protein